jgi:hypothetical protein
LNDPALSCLAALALELRPGAGPTRAALPAAEAGELAALVAADLARIEPTATALDLGLAAALFDPVELLRPGWPLHAEIERLLAAAPARGGPRVLALGSHQGRMPDALEPIPDHAGGALRLVPLLLRGDEATATRVGQAFEERLLETGMAGAATALYAQERFDVAIEHARYLTLHDLAAMMALQYEHAGLAPAWAVIESALLSPGRETWLDAPPEPLLRLVDGQARMALFDDEGWREAGFAPPEAAPDQLARAFDRFQARQRQLAALLEAHGIAVTFDHCPTGRDPRAVLRA